MGFLDRVQQAARPARPAAPARQRPYARPGPGGRQGGATQPRRGMFGGPPAPPMDRRERQIGLAAAAAAAIA
ncbi:MAG: hypothetical protein ACRD0L_08045, partial [Acidimicrobiales bacterium]